MKNLFRNKIWYFVCAGALLLALGIFLLSRPSGGGTYDNLIRNCFFETVSNGLPAGWSTGGYFPGSAYTDYGLDDGLTGRGAHIVNHIANDARFYQTVSVSPNTLYCLRGMIKADAQGGRGANLSIEGVFVFSNAVYDTKGGWEEAVLYGRTGPNQNSVTVYVRLGGYSGEATGEAWFDDVTLNRVDSVPAGYQEYSWYAEPAADQDAASGGTAAGALILCAFAYALLSAVMLRWLKAPGGSRGPAAPRRGLFRTLSLAAVLLLGFALRCAVALRVPGYDVDMGCFSSWSDTVFRSGPLGFYQDVSFCDYPPGYLWVLWAVGAARSLLGGAAGNEFLIKLPPILADLALCALLYREGEKRLPQKAALALMILYAFNPLIVTTGAAWGQADAVMLLLLYLAVLFALRGKWAAALPVYMAAVLVKPQALMFGPLGLAALAAHLVRAWKDWETRKEALRDALLGLAFAVLAALLIAGPFLLRREKPLSWLIDLYRNTMGYYGYITVNACNLYFLMGKNWVGAEGMYLSFSGEFLPVLTAYCAAVLPLFAAVLMRWQAWKAEKSTRLRLYLFLGLALALAVTLAGLMLAEELTWETLGSVMIGYTVALFALLCILGGGAENLPLLGASMLLVLFNTGTMMHERYLFPAVGLLLLAYLQKKDRRILYLAALVSLTGFFNVGCALDRNIRIGGSAAHLYAPAVGIESDMKGLEIVSAAGNCLLGAFSLYLSAVLCWKDAPVASFRLAAVPEQAGVEALPPRSAPVSLPRPLPRMTKKDWAVMGLATALYAVLALTNLGSLKAPQTAWVSRQEDEAVVIDLGEEKNFYMLYDPGIHWRSDWESAQFGVQCSLDGKTWEGGFYGSVKGGDTFDCFHWKYVSGPLSYGNQGEQLHGRYVRIVAEFPELTLLEVLFRDADTDETLPVVSASERILLRSADTGELLGGPDDWQAYENDTLPFLTDEQDTLEGEPGWYNSTYFDEIYHARTAYEHLHGLPVYENTHPPLGKLLMSAAIAVFGMTPFGWRFAGAAAGVLMLPGMYLLGRLLIRRKWGGIAALALMAFDLMHFTQTRIATIDSFVVLFIIWAVYFMLRWFFLEAPDLPLKKTLVPLGLSGLFMGLSIASKWTGCYAGAGLAVIFFLGVWRRMGGIIGRLKEAPESAGKKKKPEPLRSLLNKDPAFRRLLFTVLSCLLFFVAVPLMIYYAVYIPYFAPEGGVTVHKIIRAAEHMLSYHSTPRLGMDHAFYSPWYQWPVIAKPMWYYAGSFEAEGTASTIMALGNPAVWWGGLAGILGVLFLFIRRHYDKNSRTLSRYTLDDDPRWALLLICFFAQYLPWMLVPRGTYIYHYFPSVPFIILSALLCLDHLAQKREKAVRIGVCAWIAVSAALFAAFFPYASGVAVSTAWLDAMKWFPRWLWY